MPEKDTPDAPDAADTPDAAETSLDPHYSGEGARAPPPGPGRRRSRCWRARSCTGSPRSAPTAAPMSPR